MTDETRAQRWLRLLTDGLSPEGQHARDVLRYADRFRDTAEERSAREARARELLDALPPEESSKVYMVWKLGPHASDLSRSPIAEDVEELETFTTEVAEPDRPGVARILGAHQARTVDAYATLKMHRESGEEGGR